MSTIRIELNNSELIDNINRLADSLDDLSEPMRFVAHTLESATDKAFIDETDPTTGERWQALSDGYVKANPHRAGGQVLQDTTTLAKSISSESNKQWAQIGSNQPYAAIHHFGGTADMRPANAAIPARPYIGLSGDDKSDILDELASHLSALV